MITQRKTLRCVRCVRILRNCVRILRNVRNATSYCIARIGLQCTKLRHSKFLFCLFFCEKSVATENKKAYTLDEILFHTRDERGEFSLFNVRTPRIISSQLPASPAKFARLDRQRRQSDMCTSCHYQVKRRHVIGQTLRYSREIRTWFQLSSCVACVA